MELVILMGLQGSGKSTFYRGRLVATHVHISKDNFRNARNKERRQRSLVDAALAAGQSIVIDNTNVAAADRAPSIAQGKSAGAHIVGYYFASRLADCLERNSGREGKARVPDIAIVGTSRRLELPAHVEGFDELFYVSIGPAGEFIVTPWEADAKQ